MSRLFKQLLDLKNQQIQPYQLPTRLSEDILQKINREYMSKNSKYLMHQTGHIKKEIGCMTLENIRLCHLLDYPYRIEPLHQKMLLMIKCIQKRQLIVLKIYETKNPKKKVSEKELTLKNTNQFLTEMLVMLLIVKYFQ